MEAFRLSMPKFNTQISKTDYAPIAGYMFPNPP